MKKKFKIFAFIYFIIVGILLFKYDNLSSTITTTLEYIQCGTANGIPRPVPQLTTLAYTFILVGTPLVFIAFSIISLVKAVSTGKAEELAKASKGLIKKVIISALVFLSASLIHFVINRVTSNDDDKKSFVSCVKCFLYYSESNCIPSNTGNDISTSNYRVSNVNVSQGTEKSNKTSNSTSNGPSVVNTVNGLTTGTFENRNYALYTPESVSSNKPLIIFLHGTGERSSNINSLDNDHGLTFSIKNKGAKYNSYILMPQIKANEYWNNNDVIQWTKRLIDKIVSENQIDKNRISIWGFSLGANQLSSVVNSYPDYFSSAVLISVNYIEKKDCFKNIPLYIFGGDIDSHGKPGENLSTELKNRGYEVYYKKYSNQSHYEFVTRVINDTALDNNYKTIFDWTLAHKK